MKIIPILLLILFALSTLVEGNDITGTVKVVPTPTPSINVRIEINPKIINPNSGSEIKVTIFSNTPAGFDVASVKISTVRFGPSGAVPVRSETPAKKLMLHFNTQDTGIKCGDTQAKLTGKTYSGQNIFGSDNIRTTNCAIGARLQVDPVTKTTIAAVTAASPSGNVTLTVPNGTQALIDGNPITNISINSTEGLPETAIVGLSANNKKVVETVDLKPEGARFDPPIGIRFNYTEPLPSGVNEGTLEVRFFNASTNSWESLPIVERNMVQHYVVANITHFSTFALFGATSTEVQYNTVTGIPSATVGFSLSRGERTVSIILIIALLSVIVILRFILRRKR